MESELEYLQRRVEFHREMSRATTCPEARCTHEALVRAYIGRIEALSGSAAPAREPSPDEAPGSPLLSPAATAD